MLLLPMTILPLFVFFESVALYKKINYGQKKDQIKQCECEAIYKISQIVFIHQ